jgi:hypothetical protein
MAPDSLPSEARLEEGRYPWWQVLALTGLDYFSTLGYQPGIALLAAGALSPLATLVLVLFSLFAVLPVYRRVAEESPHGEGSIALMARLYPGWWGKVLMLVILGFMATDFTLTITLSAADAAVHLLGNPLAPAWLQGHQMGLTLGFIAVLGFVFYLGFREAIGVALPLTYGYLALNAWVLLLALPHLDLSRFRGYGEALAHLYPEPGPLLLAVALAFPKLALGLSGFETGVAVMPLIRGHPGDDPDRPRGRIQGAHRLLTAAVLIMAVLLIASSVVTTLLIPPKLWASEEVSGRAISFLAHRYAGEAVGTAYDLFSIFILWFAGASAMAGLLTIVPRYLPRLGMAPEWARNHRPVTLFFTAVAFGVTLAFRARVEAQAAAYATGVLAVMTSAAFAIYRLERDSGRGRALYFGGIFLVFLYVLGANVLERPDGVRIAAFFIASTLLVSMASRAFRAFELRVDRFVLDADAERLLELLREGEGPVRLIAHRPERPRLQVYLEKEARMRAKEPIPSSDPVFFVEVYVQDPSEFSATVKVWGILHPDYKVFRMIGTSAPNTLAAFLLYLQKRVGKRPHIYFEWPEESPVHLYLDFLLFGEGDVPTVTREILRRTGAKPEERPLVHVVG